MSWTKFNSALRSSTIFLVILLITLEFFSFLLSKANLLIVNDTPWAYRSKDDVFLPHLQWRTEESDWGAWHKPNSATKERQSCFDTLYFSNEIGARDDSFIELKNKKRIALVGDSFAEGFGVVREETAQYLMEKITGIDVLNFGSAGDLGPVQYSIIFDSLVKSYSPNSLVIFFLPNNDFTDNDYDYWQKTKKTFKSNGSERWRPYYRKSESGYVSFIPANATKTIEAKNPNFRNRYLWTHNIYKTIKFILARNRELAAQEVITGKDNLTKYSGGYSGYFDASLDQQKAAVFFIDKLISESNVPNIILVAIPLMSDLGRIASGANISSMYWYKEFEGVSSKLGKAVKFIDLAKHAPSDPTKLFFTCDGHWSPYGNKWAAETIAPFLK
jgi:hypothetical protein